MKGKILLLFILLLGFSSCETLYFDGSERYVVKGTFLVDGEPLQDELVTIDTYSSNSPLVNTTYTDKNGFFMVSFPRGNYDFWLDVKNYSTKIVDGKRTSARELIDLGVIDIAKNKR
ncbi:hypothetical protein [Myroides sp. WP-1]|uniref:hypothetical protein n=1 Tax=Myroides sp. WP-1 TaxID=2759944 RepID=UPI0015FC9376|nr:hypothetical protein [Myroides sp. WP-1]MBB1138973.1 hypothetical protein [Myroides sp. WP-1]